ncbi:MAG: hypothetical protein WC745_02350 [Patescibacteria group bacterium]|jgi:hypothetical protein
MEKETIKALTKNFESIGQKIADHFVDVNKMIIMPKNADFSIKVV